MTENDPRGWLAIIYADSAYVGGAVRRTERLHWTYADARQELDKRMIELKLGPVAWDELADHTHLGRVPHHVVIITSILLPTGFIPAV